MNTFHYRQEDRFTEESNSRRLKELYSVKDYKGLLELALLLNHQASFNNSKARWAITEALEAARPGNTGYVAPDDLAREMQLRQNEGK
jgi:hypothetical protein